MRLMQCEGAHGRHVCCAFVFRVLLEKNYNATHEREEIIPLTRGQEKAKNRLYECSMFLVSQMFFYSKSIVS